MRRLYINKLVIALSTLSGIAGLVFIFWILISLIIKGSTALTPYIFTHDLIDNGIRNLIFGQFLMTGLATLIGIPIGTLAGIYLQEYGNGKRYAEIIRNLTDVMMSAPSIVVGTFVYAIYVVPFGHTAGWAGVIALFIMILPIVVSTTDNMLSLVPIELREAGMALGAPKYHVILHIVLRSAKTGIVTGMVLAFARIVGETAPLLYTSGSSVFWSTDLTQTFPSMTVSIYNLATLPDKNLVDLAWAASLVLTIIILFLNLLGRYVLRNRNSN